jgi:hypothetical protein
MRGFVSQPLNYRLLAGCDKQHNPKALSEALQVTEWTALEKAVAACTEPVTEFKWRVAGGDADLKELVQLLESRLEKSFLMVSPSAEGERSTAVEKAHMAVMRKDRRFAKVFTHFLPL